MSELAVWSYGEHEVRTIEQNGEPWFVLKDVCSILEIGNVTDTTKRLDEDEFDSIEVIDSLGRKQMTNIVNESGLYNVILRSDKPEAKPFRKWVTSEVLPSIRKTGGYLAPSVDFTDPEVIGKLLNNWRIDRQKLLEANDKLEEQKEKVEFYDEIIDASNTLSMNEVTKLLNRPNIGRNRLFAILREMKVLDDNNLPLQTYMTNGWFTVVQSKYMHNSGAVTAISVTRVTEKGLAGIRKLLQASKY